MKAFRIFLVMLLSLFALGAWAQPDESRIKAGDRVRVMVTEEPAMNRDYTVSADGVVMVDFLGAVRIAGLTEAEAATRISEKLVSDRIIRKATVSLTLLRVQLKMVKFSGAVTLEAEAPFREGITLADIIRLAEPKPEADLESILVLSENGGQLRVDTTRRDLGSDQINPKLKPGDHVIFPVRRTNGQQGGNQTSPNQTQNPGTTTAPANQPDPPQPAISNKISVEGSVMMPGQFDFVEEMLVRDLVIRAGGFAANAETSQVTLIRPNQANRTLRLPNDGFTPVRPGDRIVVSTRLIRVLVRVEGAVMLPGEIELEEGMRLSTAIQRAGGLKNDARSEAIRVTSPNGGRPVTVNLKDIEAGYVGDIELRPGMRIEVPSRASAGDQRIVRAAGAAALLIILFGR
jgi:protein involved in polysaccharide export with SLBB domain